MALIILVSCAYPIGLYRAKTEREFISIKSSPELIVLRKYSDNLICAEFDRKKKIVSDRFFIIKIGLISEAGIQIESENIGQLRSSRKVTPDKTIEGRV